MIIDTTAGIEMGFDDMAAVFTEWQRRYREEPEAYMEAYDVAAMGLTDYGEKCAAYFAALATELSEKAG